MATPFPSDPAHTEASGDGVLDRQHLARYTLGDVGLERELLVLFMNQLSQSIAQLRAAANASEWKLACHTLKGSAAAVGAAEINRVAQALESRGFTGTPPAGDPDLRSLETASARFREAVGRIID